MTPAELSPDTVETLESLLGKSIGPLEVVGRGRNSKVFKLVCDGEIYAAKFCSDRARVTREFLCLQFFCRSGICDVPRPVILDPGERCAIYTFVEGDSIGASEVTSYDIDGAVDFLVRLHKLTKCAESHRLSEASEACFSVQGAICNIQDRMGRLEGVQANGPGNEGFREFLSHSFKPAFAKICSWVHSRALEWSISVEAQLPSEYRTLSPSDFGFHNVLRRSNGSLVFLDFEHSGWDDPAKMISDFLLHPHENMAISETLKVQFLSQVLANFACSVKLKQRLHLLYPLFGLKWCTILLNEFIPMDLGRRAFARDDGADWLSVQRRQLIKAEEMLDSVLATYQNFPYEMN